MLSVKCLHLVYLFYTLIQIELPKKEVVLARRDDAAIYDDASQMHQEFKDEKK